jgi:hypothetical protein
MIAEVDGTEMVDRLLNPIALADDENSHRVKGERTSATIRSSNIHRFCFELSQLEGG